MTLFGHYHSIGFLILLVLLGIFAELFWGNVFKGK